MKGCIAGLVAVVLALGQTPAFEVASVKAQAPWTPAQCGIQISVKGNTLIAENTDLNTLVRFAWDLTADRLSGGPGWAQHARMADSSLFRVVGKSSGDAAPSMDQFRLMLQGLLADRFQLKVHHVSKEFPVFNLVVAKTGLKLKENTSDVETSTKILPRPQSLTMTAVHARIADLAGQVSNAMGRPVFDKTGLLGFYDFQIEWAPQALVEAGPETQSGPSMITVLQTLGLKLEPATASFDTIVIDRAEKPSEN